MQSLPNMRVNGTMYMLHVSWRVVHAIPAHMRVLPLCQGEGTWYDLVQYIWYNCMQYKQSLPNMRVMPLCVRVKVVHAITGRTLL